MTMTYPFASKLRDELEDRGRLKGRAETLFELLAARGIELSEPQRELVSTCEDETTFFLWVHRSLTAESAEDVFGDM